MALPSYSTGTATVASGGTNVALTDATTAFNNVFPGDEFHIGTASAKVVDVVDDGSFTITPWPGSDETGAAYTVLQDSKLRFTDVEIALDLKKQVQFLNAQGYEIPVPDDMDEPDPTWGDDGQRAFKTNVTPWKIWLKTGGVWVLQAGSPGGPGADGADGATILVQDGEPDLDHTAGSLWIDSDSADIDVYLLGGSPLAWEDTGVNLKGSTGPAAWLPPEAWVTATAYVVGPPASVVTQGGETYVCLVAHTSGTFASDLAAGKWIKVAAKGTDGSGTGDMVAANNLSDLDDVATARTNLGLGTAAVADVGTSAGNVVALVTGGKLPAVDGSNLTNLPGGDIAAVVHAATSKTTPVDADELPLVDSAASNVLKKLTWANLKAFFATAAQGAKADSALQGAFGFRNRVVNPSGQIAQAGLASTADGAYTGFDQWIALTQTAAVTPSLVSNAENGTPFMMRLTQAQATAQRFGIIQPIESANIIDARGQSVTLSARVRMSASTTLRYAIIEWTGTADTITKDVVSSWTSTTFTTGNFFNSTGLTIAATGSVSLSANTLTSISLAGAVSGSMNNVLVFFWTDSTQAQTVTLDIGKVQLEIASSSSPLAFRSYQQELILCQRYLFYWTAAQFARFAFLYADTTTSAQLVFNLPATLRTNPTLTQTNMTANGNDITSASIQGMFATVLALNYVTSGLTANTMVQMYVKTSVTGVVKFDARL